MEWPEIEKHEMFEVVEERESITKESDDVRKNSLGVHPCHSYYKRWMFLMTPAMLKGSRRQFDRVAGSYV